MDVPCKNNAFEYKSISFWSHFSWLCAGGATNQKSMCHGRRLEGSYASVKKPGQVFSIARAEIAVEIVCGKCQQVRNLAVLGYKPLGVGYPR